MCALRIAAQGNAGQRRTTVGKETWLLFSSSPQNQIQNTEDSIMEKYIFDPCNGLWYELQGDYYIPCLVLDEAGTSPIGMWGRKHQQYLKEHRPMLYSDLVLSRKLYSYLADTDTLRHETNSICS